MSYELSDDRERFDLVRAHRWLSTQSYWAEGIPFEACAKACANNLTVGAYAADGSMAAMARVVTDGATFGWICDVFVDEGHRGRASASSSWPTSRLTRPCRACGDSTCPPATLTASTASSASPT